MTDRTATMRAVTVGTPPMTAVAVCTGAGEGFMKLLIAKVAVDGMDSASGAEAGAEAIELLSRRVNGKGGLITVDRQGFAAGGYNTDWMPHGSRRNWEP